jgi:hypothetical protein
MVATCNEWEIPNAEMESKRKIIMENNRFDAHSLFSHNLVDCCNFKFLFRYSHDPFLPLFIFSSYITLS